MLKMRNNNIQATISRNKTVMIPSNELDVFLAITLSKVSRNNTSMQEIIEAYNTLCEKHQGTKYSL